MLVTGDYRATAAELGLHLTDKARFLGKVIDGELVALAAFDEYDGTNIEVHIASRRWTRDWMRAAFHYCFNVCGCRRMTGLIDARNFHMKSYMSRLGFEYEGRMRHALPDGDIEIYGLLREDCKWVRASKR